MTKASYVKYRTRHLQQTYGISLEEYDTLLESQLGCCAICGGMRRYNLAVDHSHPLAELVGVRKSIRGLLCKRCNGLLFRVRDDPALLRRAADYLEHQRKVTQMIFLVIAFWVVVIFGIASWVYILMTE